MNFKQNISLKDKNWFCTGGAARYYVEPKTPVEFQLALLFAKKQNAPVAVLGKGANLLINDTGFQGLVIKPGLSAITQTKENEITAQAGVSIQDCIDWCLEHNLLGFEEFSGIPGSIGGAVYINVHYFSFFISNFLTKATIINKNTGEIKNVPKEWLCFGYDQSKLHAKEWFLLDATFQLKQANDMQTAYAKGRRDEIIRQRNSRYPTSHTCGSFFRNFHQHELTQIQNAQKLPYIAYYLDKLGIKGHLEYNGAIVSYQHANMLVNKGHARSQDIIMLARMIQKKVYEAFNVIPQAECQFIGFKKYPLYTSFFKKSIFAKLNVFNKPTSSL